jgi:hypothetical protein
MNTKRLTAALKCQRGSSFVVGIMFVLVNPLAATPLFSPLLGMCRAERRLLGNAFPLVDAEMDSPVTVSARTCQQWQVPPWPWILQTWRVE